MSLKLELNTPMQLALIYPQPKIYSQPGRPESHMYSVQLMDGSQERIFLSVKASQTITELRIQPREWFTICRRRTPQNVEYFDIETSRQSARSGVPVPQPAPKPPQSAHNGHGRSKASDVMGAALIAAIDATDQAKRYAAERNIPLEFDPADIRAIAATMFIQAAKDLMLHQRQEEAA